MNFGDLLVVLSRQVTYYVHVTTDSRQTHINQSNFSFEFVIFTALTDQPNLPVRLTGGPTPAEGNVEVYFNGVWDNVCDNMWDLADGFVVCRYVSRNKVISK